jgi:hypothetical protein
MNFQRKKKVLELNKLNDTDVAMVQEEGGELHKIEGNRKKINKRIFLRKVTIR